MTPRVSCPFCNTGFDLPAATTGRVPCPRCGETVAVRPPDETGVPRPSLNGDGAHPAPVVAEPPPAPSGLRPLILLASALFVAVAVGITVWLGGFFKGGEPKPGQAKPNAPRATWPPQTLAGLRYLPPDSHLVFAVQPSPLLQYAERTEQDATKVLAEGGMPKPVFDWLAEAGVTPGQIDHVAVGVKFEGLVPPFAALLALRQPLDDEGKFLARLKAKRNPDKNLYTLHVAALIADVSLVRVDDTKYLFALREEDLAPARTPAEGIAHFRKDLQDSIQRLSPSSFFWLATDAHDWKANKTLEFLATVGMGQGDRLRKLDPKLRATAVGLSLESELKVRVSTRYIDAPTATEREKGWRESLTASKGESAVEGGWATATVPLDPTDVCGKFLKLVFTP